MCVSYPDFKIEPPDDPIYVLQELETRFVLKAPFTTPSKPTHVFVIFTPNNIVFCFISFLFFFFICRWLNDRPMPVNDVLRLFKKVGPILANDPALLELEPPVYVFGDIHGNYQDLMTFSKAFGLHDTASFVPASFLFLGDYVDRGRHGLETILWLFSMKILYPKKVFLLRGNHEFYGVNMNESLYGDDSFLRQLVFQYGSVDSALKICSAANAAFAYLPFAAIVDKRIFCVHGGLPRDIVTHPEEDILELIRSIKRPITSEWPALTLCFDLVWSDPASAADEKKLGIGFPKGFGPSNRGESAAVWGRWVMDEFFRLTGCTHIIRAHQSICVCSTTIMTFNISVVITFFFP